MAQVSCKTFDFPAQWDADAAVWWCTNDELPLTTEAPKLDQLESRVTEAALEIAVLNGIARAGEDIELRITADLVRTVRVPVAA